MDPNIWEQYEQRAIKAGTVIFRENEPGDVMYIIVSGRVAISKRVMDKVDKTLNILETGDYFGEMSLLLNADRTATARAIEDTVLVEISRENLKLLLQEYLEVATNLLAQLALRLEKANEEAILLALELALIERKSGLQSPMISLEKQIIVATGSFEASNIQEVLRLRKELQWSKETNVILALIKPAQLQDALLYVIQTHDIREVMKLITCFQGLVRWNIALAVSTDDELIDTALA